MFRSLTFCVLIFLFGSLKAQDSYFTGKQFFEDVDDLMSKHVDNGTFDYQKLLNDSRAFNDMMARVDYADMTGWDDQTKKAFYINAYNLTVIKSILLAYPISSAEEVPGFFNTKEHIIANQKLTLDVLENEIIRPQYNDPRVHFVLNCGAKGCPEIIGQAYHPESLDEQMDQQTTLKLNDPKFVQFENEQRTILLSEIFSWFEDDFGGTRESTLKFINQYRTDKIPNDYKIGYYPYDWTLNSLENASSVSTNPQPKKESRRFLVSALYGKGDYELNLFNNYFSQISATDTDNHIRTGFFSNLFQVLIGINPRVNVGFDIQFRSVTKNYKKDTGLFEAAAYNDFANDDSNVYGRVGLTRIGPKVKYIPFKRLGNISVQHTFYFPFPNSDDLQSGPPGTGFLDWNGATSLNQIFYDQELGNKFSIFAELDFNIENIGKAAFKKESGYYQVSTPHTIIISYFPVDEVTIYGLTNTAPQWGYSVNVPDEGNTTVDQFYVPFNQFGIGAKYLYKQRVQLELLYTHFKESRDNSYAATYNFGLRYIFRK